LDDDAPGGTKAIRFPLPLTGVAMLAPGTSLHFDGQGMLGV
jgi:hypothetical protein